MSSNGLNLPVINIDLRNQTAWGGGGGGPRLPIGTYTMDIAHAEQGQSKKGGPTVVVTFRVADEGQYYGTDLKKTYSLNTQASRPGGVAAIGRFTNLMMAAGCDLDRIDLGQLVGSRVIVDIIHEEGQPTFDAQGNPQQGKIYCNVCNESPVQVEEEPTPPPPATKTKVAARRA